MSIRDWGRVCCPTCGVGVWMYCRTMTSRRYDHGGSDTKPHAARVARAHERTMEIGAAKRHEEERS